MVNPAAGAVFDGVDVGESDLPTADEPFGGVLAATAAATAEAVAAQGYGSAELDGAPATAAVAAAEPNGGAVLPNIVAPRSSSEGKGLVSSGAGDRRERDGSGGASPG